MRQVLEGLAGVSDVKVSYKQNKARLAYDPVRIAPRQIIDAVARTGKFSARV